MNYLTVPLSTRHKRADFTSGIDLLDRYFTHQADQDVKRKLSACFVYASEDHETVIGYYTLSGSSIPQDSIPKAFARRLPPSYTSIPMILLGRIALDKKYQGQGVGSLLLIDALRRCYDTSDSLGAYAMIVDPLGENAVDFYRKFGFMELPDSKKMFLPMQTIRELFK